ncbi:MAG: peptidase M3 [Armatimonadetes bacterium]|nr:peptidase M3 [Armatimonadota bacterium]
MSVNNELITLKETFLALHERKEDLFWIARMGLSDDPDKAQRDLGNAEIAMNRFLQDPERLRKLRGLEASGEGSDTERRILRGWIATLSAHVVEQPEARALSEEIVGLDQEMQRKRAALELGFVDPASGKLERASSNKLALIMRTDADEARRKAAYEGLRSIEKFALDADFLETVKKRNQLGRLLGYEDFYDWRTSVVERMRKRDLFRGLDDLMARTAERARAELGRFSAKHGESALQPWNFLYLRSGDLTRQLDPYFSFASGLRRWGKSFQALGIRYGGSRLTLDLLDRVGKYENGFMHGPGIGFVDEGKRLPARINFTSNAIPGQVGSGMRALETLFHEGGHAAHFSNILAPAPCFANEFAPTSIAYAETQSMFCDSIIGDADWRLRYAHDAAGRTIPMELIEEEIRQEQPFKGWTVRSLLTIPMAERALYEMEDPTPEKVLETFRRIERETQGLEAGVRPVLAVPHLLAFESSAYYHGYVMAEMAVYQTRAFFEARDGYLADNPRIGPDLARHYWAPGNEATFEETLRSLTGGGLSADALVGECNRTVDEALADARKQAARGGSVSVGTVALDARIRVIHGREAITDTTNFEEACRDFEAWLGALTPA